MEKAVRTRFAPSPTGLLHVGGARTAVFNWALARKNRGVLVLRIEDTDQERSRPEFEAAILQDLHWLGLDWDEGPYRQSERLELYHSFFARLRAQNLVYPCYCTPQELEAEREQALREGRPPRYSGKCLVLGAEERARKEREGHQPSWRFRVPSQGEVKFGDLIRGPMVFPVSSLSDFVILRSDGVPTYNFACVVDDALMRISYILRGEEHLANTPYQVLLYQALGFPLPFFAHLPIILDEHRAKLSKRRGDLSLRALAERGILPQALLNYLFTLGHSFPEGREIVSREELLALFSLERIGRAGAVFSEERLRWMNRVYLRTMSWEALREELRRFPEGEAVISREEELGTERMSRLWSVVQEEVSDLREAGQALGELLKRPTGVTLEGEYRAFLPVLERISPEAFPWENEEEAKRVLQAWQKESGLRGGVFYKAFRLVLIGREEGPELHRLLVALGKEECLARISSFIAQKEAQ